MGAGVDDMATRRGQARRQGLHGLVEGGLRMSSRDFAVVALGRFLVVERYRELLTGP